MAHPHILLIEARFYEQLNDALVEGALSALASAGATHKHIVVPGALEVPAALAMALASDAPYDGYVALGVVIRGETYHFELVACESARALMDLSIKHQLALGNGILTVENEDQAWARARSDQKDKGGDAVRAALEMIRLKRLLEPFAVR